MLTVCKLRVFVTLICMQIKRSYHRWSYCQFGLAALQVEPKPSVLTHAMPDAVLFSNYGHWNRSQLWRDHACILHIESFDLLVYVCRLTDIQRKEKRV